jgi:phosphoribosylformylglycinamidine synthase PurS subunit
VNKVYTILLEAESRRQAENQAGEMCKRLLANPTKDNYAIVIEDKK